MYNCTNHNTGSAVAWVTKDRAARTHLPSTMENQLGRRRRRQLQNIGQWKVRTLLEREAANRRTALVAMELAKYNIDIAALCETRFSVSGSLNDLEYNQLASVLSGIPRTDKLLLIGDFNARIGRDNDKWPLVMGKHVIGKYNFNGELLLALCSEFELIVKNTMFKQKDERKTTWLHPRSRHWHMIDFVIMRCRYKMDIHSTRAMRGANC